MRRQESFKIFIVFVLQLIEFSQIIKKNIFTKYTLILIAYKMQSRRKRAFYKKKNFFSERTLKLVFVDQSRRGVGEVGTL